MNENHVWLYLISPIEHSVFESRYNALFQFVSCKRHKQKLSRRRDSQKNYAKFSFKFDYYLSYTLYQYMC